MTREHFEERVRQAARDAALALSFCSGPCDAEAFKEAATSIRISVLECSLGLLASQIKFDDEPRDGETQDQFERRVGKKD